MWTNKFVMGKDIIIGSTVRLTNALALCVVHSFELCCRSEENSGFAVAFCGSQLKVASAVLQSSITKAEKIEKKLLPLRSVIEPNQKTVAFMFACIGPGKHFYRGTENVESTAFRKVFPKVPLFGFFGNGEIGFDFVPKDGNDIINFLDSNPNLNMFHSYTTIFVVISFWCILCSINNEGGCYLCIIVCQMKRWITGLY